jgi:hypothetical protein
MPGKNGRLYMSQFKREIPLRARVKMSALGGQRCPRMVNKVGIVVRASSGGCSVQVQFEGNKTATPLHRDYIEPYPETKRTRAIIKFS